VDAMTRRRFLVTSGVVAGGALAAGAGAYTLWDILATADDPAKGLGDRTLVLITLYGGNDGLAAVIPYADSAYHDARPGLSYSADQVLRLDDHTGLNPSFKGFKQLYDGQQLAILRGVGYPKPDRSHFRSMDIWQTGNPSQPGNTGWLGRWLDGHGGDPRLAVSFEPVLPPLLAGATSAGASVPPTGQKAARGVSAAAVTALGRPSAGEPALQARAAGCFDDLVKVDAMITQVRDAAPAGTADEPATPPATGTGGGQAPLAAQLDLVGQCVEAGVSTRVFSVSLGGFDFHADEKAAEERILSELDSAVSAFATRMGRTDRGRKVTVVIYSEFGRRVHANASDGTDHGTASNVFVLGPEVAGGRLIGDQPSLTDLDNGDLKSHVDFRDLYASLLTDVLGAEPGPVLADWSGRMPGLLRVP
jgi:uncharacterized protein (DUF1501 family)